MSEKTPFSYSSDEDKASKQKAAAENPFAATTREQVMHTTEGASANADKAEPAKPARTAFDASASNAAPASAGKHSFEESGEDFSHKARETHHEAQKQPVKKASVSKQSNAAAGSGDKPAKKAGKKSRTAVIIAAVIGALLVVAICCTALYYFGVVDFFPQKAYTYEATDTETFLKYLSHPSLKAGDTINTTGDIVVDVDEQFGGFVSLPLVNLNGVEFKNGSVLFLGEIGRAHV